MPTCLLGLGSNLGNPEQTLLDAMKRIAEHKAIHSAQSSTIHHTKPVGGPSGQGEYANAAVKIETDLPPQALIERLQEIEKFAGRERRQRWAARTLDIDLLLHGDLTLSETDLKVPHPRMSFRPFVLSPAVEVARGMMHPYLLKTLGELFDQLKSGGDWLAIEGGDRSTRKDVADLTMQTRPGIEVKPVSGARLTIALNAPDPLPGGGPTLWLPSDMSESQRRVEIAAALECVWPGLG